MSNKLLYIQKKIRISTLLEVPDTHIKVLWRMLITQMVM